MAAAQAQQNARAANAANAANAQGHGIASYFPKVAGPQSQSKTSAAPAATPAEAPVAVKKAEQAPVDEASRKGMTISFNCISYFHLQEWSYCTLLLQGYLRIDLYRKTCKKRQQTPVTLV